MSGTNGGAGNSVAVNAASARASTVAATSKANRGVGQAKATDTSKLVGNSGKNTVGHAKDGKTADYDGGRDNAAGDDVGKDKHKPLYGFQSAGPERSKIPKEANEPKTKKKVTLRTEEAQPDKPVKGKKLKINHSTSDIATTGKLSHSRVGVAQKMCSFGSHRRSHNWIQPGVAKAQLLGPFSDHMHFKQRLPQGHS